MLLGGDIGLGRVIGWGVGGIVWRSGCWVFWLATTRNIRAAIMASNEDIFIPEFI